MNFRSVLGWTGIVAGPAIVVLSLLMLSERIGFTKGLAAGRLECLSMQRDSVERCSEEVVALADEVVERLRVIERRHDVNPHLLDSLRVDRMELTK